LTKTKGRTMEKSLFQQMVWNNCTSTFKKEKNLDTPHALHKNGLRSQVWKKDTRQWNSQTITENRR
jgi:hypothetical protein